MNNFYDYLLKKGYAPNTIRANQSTVNTFLQMISGLDPTKPDTVMEYVRLCKEKGNIVHTIRQKLKALDHYFEFLGLVVNPVNKIRLKGVSHKVPQLLLSQKELDEVYKLQPTGGLVAKRNKILLSIAIYQGASTMELSQIEVTDLNLQEGTIYIPKGRSANSRTLELKSHQLLLMQDYLLKTRPALMKEYNIKSRKLIFSTGEGTTLLQNAVYVLLRKLRPGNPKLKSLQQIRQSRITIWIEQHGLRQAQYMAGHRYVSSTERYRQDQTESLRNELNMHHPL